MYFLSTEGRIRETERKEWMSGVWVSAVRRRGRRRRGEVNNESVPNKISNCGRVGLWEASGASVCLLVSWCQECRSVKVKAPGHLLHPPGCCYCLTVGLLGIPYTHILPLPQELSALALSDLRDSFSCSLPLPLTEYISCFVHLPPLSPPFSTSQLLSPQAARPSFDFPINPGYGAWKWLDPIILEVSKRPEVILNEIVTVWGVLRDAKRVKLWLSSSF